MNSEEASNLGPHLLLYCFILFAGTTLTCLVVQAGKFVVRAQSADEFLLDHVVHHSAARVLAI
jgi:hypothetical protein